MKAVKFKHQNVVFAENQPEYQSLPALRIDSPEGIVISCWKLSLKERIKIVFTGRVWLSIMSFNEPLSPSFMAVNRKEVYSHPDDGITFLQRIKKFFSGCRYFQQNDPTKKCEAFKNEGCSHVDGPLCNFPNCSINIDYTEENKCHNEQL